MKLVLRYFDVRGRAQFIRYFLASRGIEFEDVRIELGADFAVWLSIRDDQRITGPFKRLPVMSFDELQVPEAPVIAEVLHRRFGDPSSLDETTGLRHSVLLSSLYSDSMYARGTLIWADISHPGVDMREHVRFALRRVSGYLDCLEASVREWNWLQTPRRRAPLIADCLLWEELDALDAVFGPAFRLDNYPALAEFHSECPGRKVFEQVRDSRPSPFTGRPGEADMIRRLHAIMTELRQEQST